MNTGFFVFTFAVGSKIKVSRNLKNSCDNVASIRVLVLFEQYGQQKNAPTKVIPTFFPCIFHVQTQCLQM